MANQTVVIAHTITLDGTTYHPNDVVSFPAEEAQSLIGAGYASVTAAAPTVDPFVQRTGDAIAPQVVAAEALSRLDRQAATLLQRQSGAMIARIADAGVPFTEAWANTTAWTGTGTVVSGRVYSAAGLTRPAPTSARWVARTTLHTTGAAGKYAYFGAGASTAAGDLIGIGQTSGSAVAAINRGANIAAGNVIIPRALPALAAGDYLCTVAADETWVSFTIQSIPSGQNVYGARVARASFPGGVVNTLFVSANDTAAGGMTWGPMVVYSELAVPPAAYRTVGGVPLFAAGSPLVVLRASLAGYGHVLAIPGDNDARVAAPLVVFMHQSLTGNALVPWTETRFANVLAALDAAGYILVASDNGPAITAGGTQDRYGNQSGLDDYAGTITYARTHANTGALFLLGASMGAIFAENMVARREVGGIAAVATISGGLDLPPMTSDPTYGPPLLAAYAATDSVDFRAKVVGYNPASQPGWVFRGVPQRIYVGDADTLATPAIANAHAARLAPYGEAQVLVSAGAGHLANALYQGSDLVAFFDRFK